MSTTRYSKQRETIYQVLKNDNTHPNVDTIYMHVKQEIPDISLGTVYRNLSLLAEQKRILKLDVGDGVVHYDARMEPHLHFVCEDCGAIEDLFVDESIMRDLISGVQQGSDKKITSVDILFHGKCEECCYKDE